MPADGLLPLPEFIALVNATDTDAPFRMPILEEAAPLLYGASVPTSVLREPLADRFERWRYQLLNNRGGQPSRLDQQLIDQLDLAEGLIREGRLHPAKNPRSFLASASPSDGIADCLDPERPLEELSRRAAEVTGQHFGGNTTTDNGKPARWRMTLYAPLYLSSFCINHCLYCAFRYPHPLERKHLSTTEALAQAAILRERGFRHLLLVAGDYPKLDSLAYFIPIVKALAAEGFTIAIEIAPQSTLAYGELARAGACGVTLYQETYQEGPYARYHPRGTKVWFDWRLEGPERAAAAGMSRLGLGILLGLADPRQDLLALIGHGRYLRERFPDIRLAFSLPRIHEAPEGFVPGFVVSDDTIIRLYCALRLAFPTADLVLSTRESPALRNQLARICITQMSAGSSTSPGGYDAEETDPQHRQQFPVCDHRTPAEVADWLAHDGFRVRWELAL